MMSLMPYIGWFAFGATVGFFLGAFAVCLTAWLYSSRMERKRAQVLLGTSMTQAGQQGHRVQ